MVGNRTERRAHWIGALAWIGAWALVVAAGHFLPVWAALAFAIAVFGAQLLLAPGRGACHLPETPRAGVTECTRPGGR